MSQIADFKITDSHVHIGKWDFLVQDATSVAAVAAELATCNIYKFVAMITPDGDTRKGNGELLKQTTKHQYFFYWINPEADDPAEVRRTIGKHAGLKLHPSYAKMRIDDPKIAPFLEILQDTNKPLIVHCGRLGEYSSFTYPVDVSGKYNFPIILAHMGGPPYHMKAQALSYIRKRKSEGKAGQIYVDTSTCFQPFLVRKAVEYLGENNIIFGSDFPLYHPKPSLETILMSDVPVTVKRKILSENFEKLIQR